MIQGELFPYTFGTSSPEERDQIDAHLLGCRDCLRAYLRLKHHVERGASLDARPGDAIRRRVRDDVAAVVRPRGAARVRRWLRRPIPLYQGLAVAAVAAGIALAGPWLREATLRRPPQIEARVDTSRDVARSLSIY
jgi:anti-sigma factor RsiW